MVKIVFYKISYLVRTIKIYLTIPATSTSSERLFSDAGNLLTTKRTRILPELFKRMIFFEKKILSLNQSTRHFKYVIIFFLFYN